MAEKTYTNRHRGSVGAAVEAVADKAVTSAEKWQRMEIYDGPSSVGVSISIGRSESYGSAKYSVTVNHHVSVTNDVDEKAAAFIEAKSFCMEKVLEVEKSVQSQIFPNNFKENQ